MFEISQIRPLIYGFGMGGGVGFLLHKNLKISKGLGIGLGGILGVLVAYQILKIQAPIKEQKRMEGLKKYNDCKKKYNIGIAINPDKMTKEEIILATKKNDENAQKYGALCNSYIVKEN